MTIRLSTVAIILAGFAIFAVNTFAADGTRFGPLPTYTSNVTKTDMIGAGSAVIQTKDSVDQVASWYDKNLKDKTHEITTPDGHHMFYTVGGATVDVGPGIPRFDPDTKIGLVWDAKKYP